MKAPSRTVVHVVIVAFLVLVAWVGDLQLTSSSTDFSRSSSSSSRSLKSKEYASVTECLTPELSGSWVKEANRTLLNPICCSQNNFHDFPEQCGTERMKHNNGSTTPGRNYHGSLEFLPHHDALTCTACKKEQPDPFVWKSPALSDEWSAKDFCNPLGDRRLLMIGDSLTAQISATLMNAVHYEGCQTKMFHAHSTLLIDTWEGVGAITVAVDSLLLSCDGWVTYRCRGWYL